MKIDLAQSLADLAKLQGEGDTEDNPVLSALDTPQVKTAILALILNEIRAFKSTQVVQEANGITLKKQYDTNVGFAKLSAWAELLDIPAFIEARNSTPESPAETDRLPDA
jgi:hypothetical protein